MSVEHSRAVRLAEGATGGETSELERRLEGSTVLVGVDPSLPGAHLTMRVLLTTLRRLPGRLILDRSDLPSSSVDHLQEAVAAVDPDQGLEVVRGTAIDATVRLRVGTTASGGAIRVVPDGYGAQLAKAVPSR